jgi:hypothetical protein
MLLGHRRSGLAAEPGSLGGRNEDADPERRCRLRPVADRTGSRVRARGVATLVASAFWLYALGALLFVLVRGISLSILDSRVARRILQHLHLPARAPPEPPTRQPPPFWPTAEAWN